MKSFESRSNCYFTHSVVVDLVFILKMIFEKEAIPENLRNIYSEDYISTLRDSNRFLGEIISSLPNHGLDMLEFLLFKKSFNDIEEYKDFIYSRQEEEFFYIIYGELIDREILKLAIGNEEGLNELYSNYNYISTSYLALKSLFSNKELFLKEFFRALENLYTKEFIEEYKKMESIKYKEYERIDRELSSVEPLALSEKIMGKIFNSRGPFNDFIFIPSCFLKKSVRFFYTDQILIYSRNKDNLTKNDVIKILKIISDETRFEIIELLRESKSMIGKDLAASLKLSTPTISHHIDQLKEIGFINEERIKNSKFYSINHSAVDRFLEYLSYKLKNDL